jgi:hypothetical protein
LVSTTAVGADTEVLRAAVNRGAEMLAGLAVDFLAAGE